MDLATQPALEYQTPGGLPLRGVTVAVRAGSRTLSRMAGGAPVAEATACATALRKTDWPKTET